MERSAPLISTLYLLRWCDMQGRGMQGRWSLEGQTSMHSEAYSPGWPKMLPYLRGVCGSARTAAY